MDPSDPPEQPLGVDKDPVDVWLDDPNAKVIDPATFRSLEPLDEDLIPQGYRQVKKVDPETGEVYYILEEIPLGVLLPLTGEFLELMEKMPYFMIAVMCILGAGLILGIAQLVRRR
jgi:hypothetical protein